MKKIIICTSINKIADLSIKIDEIAYREKFAEDYYHNLIDSNFNNINIQDCFLDNIVVFSILSKDDKKDDYRFLLEAIKNKLEPHEYEIKDSKDASLAN